MQRKDKGFTLVELVVVVATLAIKQMNMSQFQITSPTRTFIIFLAKVNTLQDAYDAYEKLLTEGKYAQYKDTLPEL